MTLRQFFNQHKPKSTAGIFEHVVAQFEPQPEGIALDICCGTGQLTAILSEYGYQAYGVDISDAFIGRESDGDAGFVVADVNYLPLAANQAQVITFIDSLQYFDDPDAIIAELARLMTSDGKLILSCQNNYNPAGMKKWLMQTLTGRTWSPWLAHPVENFLRYPQIIRMLEQHGFEIEYVRGKQFGTAIVSVLPGFIRHWTPQRDKPWRSLAGIAGRINLPDAIEESFLRRFGMIVLIRARKV